MHRVDQLSSAQPASCSAALAQAFSLASHHNRVVLTNEPENRLIDPTIMSLIDRRSVLSEV